MAKLSLGTYPPGPCPAPRPPAGCLRGSLPSRARSRARRLPPRGAPVAPGLRGAPSARLLRCAPAAVAARSAPLPSAPCPLRALGRPAGGGLAPCGSPPPPGSPAGPAPSPPRSPCRRPLPASRAAIRRGPAGRGSRSRSSAGGLSAALRAASLGGVCRPPRLGFRGLRAAGAAPAGAGCLPPRAKQAYACVGRTGVDKAWAL